MREITPQQLKKARHIQEMTQDEAAKLLGIHRSYLSSLENGKVTPSHKLKQKIEHTFGKTVDEFYFPN